ncbi:MAG: oligosaccharide flippase family protein [Candidatus Rifleibacteriota bacterium]
MLGLCNSVTMLIPVFFFLCMHEKIYFDAMTRDEEYSSKVSTLIITGFVFAIALVIGQTIVLRSVDTVSLLGIPFYPHLFFSIIAGSGGFFIVAYSNILRGENNPRKFAYFSIANFAFTTVLTLSLLYFKGLGILSFIYANAAGNILFGLITVLILIYQHGISFSWEHAKSMLKFSLPLVPHNFAHWLKASIDKIWITTFLGLREAGLLQISTQIVSILSFAVEAFISSNNPRFISLLENNAPPRKIVTMLPTSIFLIMIPSLILAFFSQELLLILAKPNFLQASYLIPFFIVASLIHLIYCNTVTLLFRKQKTSEIGKITIVSTIVSTGISYLLISGLGLTGAGFSNIAHSLMMTTLVFIACQRSMYLPWPIKKVLFISFAPLTASILSVLHPESGIILRLGVVLMLVSASFAIFRKDLKSILEKS